MEADRRTMTLPDWGWTLAGLLFGAFVGLIVTTMTVIGHQPLDDADKALRRHIIGGSLYDGDDEIRRPATGEDYGHYSSVMTAPALVVLNLIRAAMDQFPMAGR